MRLVSLSLTFTATILMGSVAFSATGTDYSDFTTDIQRPNPGGSNTRILTNINSDQLKAATVKFELAGEEGDHPRIVAVALGGINGDRDDNTIIDPPAIAKAPGEGTNSNPKPLPNGLGDHMTAAIDDDNMIIDPPRDIQAALEVLWKHEMAMAVELEDPEDGKDGHGGFLPYNKSMNKMAMAVGQEDPDGLGIDDYGDFLPYNKPSKKEVQAAKEIVVSYAAELMQ